MSDLRDLTGRLSIDIDNYYSTLSNKLTRDRGFRIEVTKKMTRKVIAVEAMKALIIRGETNIGKIVQDAKTLAGAMDYDI
jgi:hypothetical protein